MKRSDKKSEDKRLRVLHPGESFLVSHTLRELEVILYRPIQRSDAVHTPGPSVEETGTTNAAAPAITLESPASVSEVGSSEIEDRPLFFDTTACFFLDASNKVDYVTPGHTGISTQGAVYLPHAVVTGREAGIHHTGLLSAPVAVMEDTANSTWTVTSPLAPQSYTTTKQSGVVMAPGDGVLLTFSGLNTCIGALICGTLFTPGVSLSHVTNTFFVVRRPKAATPLCFIPITVSSDACNSCVALMLRHVRVKGEVSWELVNVAEGIGPTDVKGVLRALQMRGLRDPSGYSGGALLAADSASDDSGCDSISAESSNTQNEAQLEEAASQCGQESETPRSQPKVAELTVNHTPRLVRCGKHQYNVGRSAARPDSSSEEDEAMDDVLRAVMPRYAVSEVVRYETGAYNVGSRPTTLAAHYVEHREQYAVEASGITKHDTMTARKSAPGSKHNSLGPISHCVPTNTLAENRRDSDNVPQDSASLRPQMPLELLSPSARAAALGAQQTREGTSPRHRTSRSRSRSHSVATKTAKKKSTKRKHSGNPDATVAKRPPSARRGVSPQRTTSKKKHASSSRGRSTNRRKVAA